MENLRILRTMNGRLQHVKGLRLTITTGFLNNACLALPARSRTSIDFTRALTIDAKDSRTGYTEH